MRRYFLIVLFLLIVCVVLPPQTSAVRYAQCDACGLCKDTTRSAKCDSGCITPECNAYKAAVCPLSGSTDPGSVIFVQPQSWPSCVSCLYPALTLTPPVGRHIDCGMDDDGKDVLFVSFANGQDVVITNTSQDHRFRCDTLSMADYTASQVNAPTIVPQSGRLFSDLGCISVNTTGGTFTDPNASVDVIQILLKFITSITGGVGVILVMVAGFRLIISRGDPEKIREAKKTLTNVILGVLFALFALFIFQFFAVQVLRIPGFN